MFCPKCGSNIADGSTFCSACGNQIANAQPNNFNNINNAGFNNYSAPVGGNPNASLLALAEQNHPMKWFKFLVYFALFAGAVINLIGGLTMLTGGHYGGYADQVYAILKDLKTTDMLCGVLTIAVAVLGIYTRMQLVAFKKTAPNLVVLTYAAGAVVNLIYIAMATNAFNGHPGYLNVSDVTSSAVTQTAVSAAMCIANYKYFQNRKECFVN